MSESKNKFSSANIHFLVIFLLIIAASYSGWIKIQPDKKSLMLLECLSFYEKYKNDLQIDASGIISWKTHLGDKDIYCQKKSHEGIELISR